MLLYFLIALQVNKVFDIIQFITLLLKIGTIQTFKKQIILRSQISIIWILGKEMC